MKLDDFDVPRRSVPTPAGALSVVDDGPTDAPPLVFLHGNPTWSYAFRHLMSAFKSTHRVVAIDHLGCGLSDRPSDFSYRLKDHVDNVGRVVDALGLQDYRLVVHDWGGAIGMGHAVARPEAVRGFVVMNTAAFPSPRIPFSINLCRIPGFGALAIRGFNAFARVALLRCVKKRDRITPELVRGYLAPYQTWRDREAHLRFVEDIPMGPEHPSWSTLSGIADGLEQFAEHPMLIMFGAEDFCFDPSFYREWRARFPRAEAHLLDGCGHYVMEDAREEIIYRMGNFLEASA